MPARIDKPVRRLLSFTIAFIVGAALWGAVGASGAAAFCTTKIVNDYTRPLTEMPPLRGLPEHQNDLPFGPAGLSLINKSSVQVSRPAFVQTEVPETRQVGFALSYAPAKHKPTPALNWQVTAGLVRVGARGAQQRPLTVIAKKVSRMTPDTRRTFLFKLPPQPSMYRLEIEFRNGGGRRLGRFGVYLRVLRPTLDARIALNAPSYRPGDTISACLENLGTESLMSGLEGFEIQAFDGSAWTRSAIDPPHVVPFGTQLIGPGEGTPAGVFQIPGNAPPGLYRWFLGAETWNTPNPRAPVTLASEFRIDTGG